MTISSSKNVEKLKIAVILAGGQSSRFGKDKVFAHIQGKTLLEILIQNLSCCHFKIFLSGPKDKLSVFGLPVLEDEHPFSGPLMALQGIFKHIHAPKILLTACDMPLLRPRVAQELWKRGQKVDLAFLKGGHSFSPLPGIYHRKITPLLNQLVLEEKRALKKLLDYDLETKFLESEELKQLDPDGFSLLNINTPEDFETLLKSIPLQKPLQVPQDKSGKR